MPPVIIAKNLYKCYAGFAPVLRGVNIEVEPGELVAIMGPSGCGKSTMLHVLGMLHAPDSGTLEILGTDVLKFNREQTAAFRRGNMGFVMQASNLFDHSTVFENVEFPLIYERVPPAERWERVIRALELVRLSARVHYRSNRLSGGEQQRVAIARAMVNNPRILLADEPTGALDARTSRVVMDNFRTLCHSGGVAMIMVTHDPKMADFCDSVYTLDDGILNCHKRELPEVARHGGRNLLAAPEPVLRGALVAENFPEASGCCVMEEAHRMHAGGLLSRIYALRGQSMFGDTQYALPLPVRRIGKIHAMQVFGGLFRHIKGAPHTLWQLWRVLPSPPGIGGAVRKLWDAGCGALLARWAREEKIQFLYAVGACRPATAVWIAAKLLGIPFAFTVRQDDLRHFGNDWVRKAADAAFVRCDTRESYEQLRRLLPTIPQERLVLLYNPLTLTPPDDDTVMPPPPGPQPLHILAAGTLCRRKGYDVLLRACALLAARKVDVDLTIAGTGPLLRRLRWLAFRLGLRKRVSFLKQVPHDSMGNLYRAADVFVAPGITRRSGESDGLPSALAEAMAFALPVVASDVPGQLEVVEDGKSGLVVPQGDPAALADALERLARSPKERERLGKEAWRRVRDVLDVDHAEERLTGLFDRAFKVRRG